MKLEQLRDKKFSLTQADFATENEFYKWFFTKNSGWNGRNPNYDESIRWEGIKGLTEKVKNESKDTFTILDLGCGRGWLSNLLSQFGTVTGIEPVAPVAKYAKTLFPKLTFIGGDASSLIKKGFSAHFNLVVSTEVIEHVLDQEKEDFLRQIYMLLKEDGYAILSTPRKEALEEYLKYIQPSQPIEDWLTENDLRRLLSNVGFNIIEMQRIAKKLNESVDLEVYQLWLVKKMRKISFANGN